PQQLDRVVQLDQEPFGSNVVRRWDVADPGMQPSVYRLHGLDQLRKIDVLAALGLLDDLGRQDVDSIPFALELRSAEKERPTELAILLEQSQITVVPAHPHIEMPQHFFIQGHVRAPDSLGMKPPEVVQKNIECGA